MPICLPVIGTQGIAQLVGVKLETSGTIAWIRPICIGSILFMTVPRYLPKNLSELIQVLLVSLIKARYGLN